MLNFIRDLAPLLVELLVTLAIAFMVFTGRLNGGLLEGIFEIIGRV